MSFASFIPALISGGSTLLGGLFDKKKDNRKHNMAVPGFDGAVHHQHIAIVNASARHGVAHHPEEEGCRLVAHQVGIEIQAFIDIIVCRGGKSGGDAMLQQRQTANYRGKSRGLQGRQSSRRAVRKEGHYC